MIKPLSRIQQREDAFLYGREQHLRRYRHYLDGQSLDGRNIWNIHGTGGVGKSTLLDAFRRMSVRQGGVFVYLDSRDFHHSSEGVCNAILQQLPMQATSAEEHVVIESLQSIASEKRLTLAFDTYEEMDDVDGWLRDRLIQWLPEEVLVIIVGRLPLTGVWQLSPAWRERLDRFPALSSFDRQVSFAYLRQCGIDSPEQQEKIWQKSRGHPLALSLAISTFSADIQPGDDVDDDWFANLVSLWLREVPDRQVREWVEVASVLRQFDQESLSFVHGNEVPFDLFNRLTRLSFVRRAAKGWTLHDLMRDAAGKLLKERSPDRYKSLLHRCALFYASRIARSPRDGTVAWALGELFAYIGNATIRWLVSPTNKGHYYWESLTEQNLDEARAYIQRRHAEARPYSSSHAEPDEDNIREQAQEAHMDLMKINELNLENYLSLSSQIVKLLRTPQAEIVGLSVIVPINSHTIPHLLEEPLAAPYLNSLGQSDFAQLLVPPPRHAGKFIREIDIADSEDPTLPFEAASHLFSLMAAEGLIITSPPPHPLYIQSHLDMGFAEVPDVKHTYYDGVTPTSTFVLDTRGNKWNDLIDLLLKRTGISDDDANPPLPQPESDIEIRKDTAILKGLTERERETAELALQGLSNAQIGAELFISEITVKKHLHSVYEKLNIRNRKELLRLFISR